MKTIQFAPVERGELRQFRAPDGRQVHSHKTPVARNWRFPNEPGIHGSIYQRHYGVMPLLQEFPQFGNRGPSSSRKSRNSQHQLMLLRRYACIPRRSFTETQESPQTVAELRKLAHRPRIRFLQFQC